MVLEENRKSHVLENKGGGDYRRLGTQEYLLEE